MAKLTDLAESHVCTHLHDQLPISPESTVSRVVVNNRLLRVVAFGFDAGEQLTDHASPRAVVVHVTEGRLVFTVGSTDHDVTTGDVIYLAPGERHAVQAIEPSRISLVMVDPEADAAS